MSIFPTSSTLLFSTLRAPLVTSCHPHPGGKASVRSFFVARGHRRLTWQWKVEKRREFCLVRASGGAEFDTSIHDAGADDSFDSHSHGSSSSLLHEVVDHSHPGPGPSFRDVHPAKSSSIDTLDPRIGSREDANGGDGPLLDPGRAGLHDEPLRESASQHGEPLLSRASLSDERGVAQKESPRPPPGSPSVARAEHAPEQGPEQAPEHAPEDAPKHALGREEHAHPMADSELLGGVQKEGELKGSLGGDSRGASGVASGELRGSLGSASAGTSGELRGSLGGASGESALTPLWQKYDEAVEDNNLRLAFDYLERPEISTVDRTIWQSESELGLGSGTDAAAADALDADSFYEDEGVLPPGMSFSTGLSRPSTPLVPDQVTATVERGEQRDRYLRILDIVLTSEDETLVSKVYRKLHMQGYAPSFGQYQLPPSVDSKPITPAVLKSASGLDATRLSPKKWGLSNPWGPLAAFAAFTALVNYGVDVRVVALALAAAGTADALLLGGTGVGQLLSLWPPYRRRVLVHEAGHVVAAYLLGCPVRGVILDAGQAVRLGIQGQAGTQFWDSRLAAELSSGRLTSTSLDRYHVVLFAGIAAEALVYGEAEGGESDENLFKALVLELQPPWSAAKMSNQARWAVLQAFTLLKTHQKLHEAVVGVLERGGGMADIIRSIEDSVPPQAPLSV